MFIENVTNLNRNIVDLEKNDAGLLIGTLWTLLRNLCSKISIYDPINIAGGITILKLGKFHANLNMLQNK